MKIYLFNQTKKFEKHLSYLKSKKVMKYKKSALSEKVTSIEVNSPKKVEEFNLDFLFPYQIFPSNIMSSLNQWDMEKRKMKIGDTIVQQVYLPPIKSCTQKIIFGVRINEIIDKAHKKGFSYETLEGHVEKGISTFTIEQTENKVLFKIHTYSSPGNFLTKLLGPIFSVPYQSYCTQAALKNVKQQLEKQ